MHSDSYLVLFLNCVAVLSRDLVDGYETHDERQARLAQEQREQAAGRQRRLTEALRRLHEVVSHLEELPPDCVLEVPYKPLFRSTRRLVGQPAWYLGSFCIGDHSPGDYHPGSYHYVVDAAGRVYENRNGVGKRKEFIPWPSLKPVAPAGFDRHRAGGFPGLVDGFVRAANPNVEGS